MGKYHAIKKPVVGFEHAFTGFCNTYFCSMMKGKMKSKYMYDWMEGGEREDTKGRKREGKTKNAS